MLDHFHPTLAAWFRERLGEPSPPQQQGWPLIAAGHHVLIAAPTGSGKTLAAFLLALDSLLRQGEQLRDELQVVYVSPLRALANDVQKNLQQPLQELQARDPSLPALRIAVRSGDTPASERQTMLRQPPHILVTTPESLYLLLTSTRGRRLLCTARTLITDEIHALAGSKRGSHYAVSCERLTRLVEQHGGGLQRIGLSATQRPIEATAALLVGSHRDCRIVDIGHRRQMDLDLLLPRAPLATVCSGELWQEIDARIEALIRDHRTTLVFVNTRKMAERVAARLAERLGKQQVTSHHGSLARHRRLDAEQRLKRGELRALVATSSLELGIDIGEVDLVLQIGPTASIAALLQRVGRAGHQLDRLPKGRIVPLTRDELAAAAALLYAVRCGELDRTVQPIAPLDILSQQLVAIAADETLTRTELLALLQGAYPYRELGSETLQQVIALHQNGRQSLLHHDPVHDTVRGTRRARLTALMCGGAIPDVADWQVRLDHDDLLVGTVHEDFAIESSVGDVFQLGNTSWRICRVGSGQLRVVDAGAVPPSLPFWFGEGPGRSAELSAALGTIRQRGRDPEWLRQQVGLDADAAAMLAEYLAAGQEALAAMPDQDCLVLERFFDETGGQQLVLHSVFGSRCNRAFGLALRKRFCTGFGFELQAAANDEALLLSLGPMHSFPLAEVFQYLHPESALAVLVQALLTAPMFQVRWRWNITRALLVERNRNGKPVPAPLLRFRADDALALAFPQVQACPETMPAGPLPVPPDHPIVAQTIADCLDEAMDATSFLALLRRIANGSIRLVARDTNGPSPFAFGILQARPYAFLDDAPLEERRTQAVLRAQRGGRNSSPADQDLDPAIVQRVAAECWPDPRSAAELHEVLGWIGWLQEDEMAAAWRPWLAELLADGRAVLAAGRYHAAGPPQDELAMLRGRLAAIVPLLPDELPPAQRELLLQLEVEGTAMRAHCGGREVFLHRRLLLRIRRLMIEQLRAAIEPVSPADYERFAARWQGRAPATQRRGPAGLRETLRQLAGRAHSAAEWEQQVLPQHLVAYQREWLDQATVGGEFVWLRLWTPWRGPLRRCGISLLPREHLPLWLELAGPLPDHSALDAAARTIAELLQQHGALFPGELAARDGLLPCQREDGLATLIGSGLASCDSFAALRQLAAPPARRRLGSFNLGRIGMLPRQPSQQADGRPSEAAIHHAAQTLLQRHGVLSHTLLLAEREPLPWRWLLPELRSMELRGDVRGGRFVHGWSGEQYALPTAIAELRAARQSTACN